MNTLLLDIETAPNKVYSWGLFNQNISINQIVESGYTLCYAAKWLGEKKVMFDSIHKSGADAMVKSIYALLEEADAVIHYNGKKFDMPTLNKEFLLQGLTPPSPYKQIDLLSTARGQFRFTSNKLDYVCQQLGLGAKTHHTGMQLWNDCMNGCDKAWRLMEKYNRNDVVIMEALYHKLLPWIVNHPHHGLYVDDDEPCCKGCGSGNLYKQGFAYTLISKFQQYSCKDCGRWMRGKKCLKGVDIR